MRRPQKTPRYCQGFVDRTGKPRWYFRKKGSKLLPLPGLPWSPEFMAAYQIALQGGEDIALSPGLSKSQPGTVAAVIASYYRTAEFLTLAPITKSTYRNVLEKIRAEHGEKRIALLQREHIKRMMAKLSDRPTTANKWLKMFRLILNHALDLRLRKDNPVTGIRKLKVDGEGYRTWTEEEIEKFEKRHGPKSRANLAVNLLLYTGQRRGDVVQMGKQHLRDGILSIRQGKTKTPVDIPVHPNLKTVLARLSAGQLTFLLTTQGKPFTPAGFTNWFRDRVVEAGLPEGLSSHGLRKAACRRLAEAGCTPHQIMAISGHKSLQEVTGYTAAADRKNSHMKRFRPYRQLQEGH